MIHFRQFIVMDISWYSCFKTVIRKHIAVVFKLYYRAYAEIHYYLIMTVIINIVGSKVSSNSDQPVPSPIASESTMKAVLEVNICTWLI